MVLGKNVRLLYILSDEEVEGSNPGHSTSFIQILDYTSLRNKSRLPRCTFQKSEEEEEEKDRQKEHEARKNMKKKLEECLH